MSCGCGAQGPCGCDERTPLTPLDVTNRPGLPALRRRVATHATAKATMLRALPGQLTSRADDDFAIALTDAAAVALDLLTFYAERVANEHYLRTATETRSAAELARLLGYQVQPGLAATTHLTFTLDPAPGAPAQSPIPAGTGVQSTPDPGQSAVVYETLEDVLAAPAWNAIRPRPRVPHPASPGAQLAFAGTVSGIAAGDGVLYLDGGTPTFGLVRSVRAVDAVPDLPGAPGSPARTEVALAAGGTHVGPLVTELPGAGAAGPLPASLAWLAGKTLTAETLDAELLARSATLADVAGQLAASAATPGQAFLFRQQRALFGSQAPTAKTLASTIALDPAVQANLFVRVWAQSLSLPWESATAATFPDAAAGDLYLDGATPAVPADSLLVLRDGATWGAYHVKDAAPASLAFVGISGRATRLQLASTTDLASFSIRRTTAYAAPEALALADTPAPDTVGPGTIELDGLQLGLRAGRRVIVTGEPADERGLPLAHPTTLAKVEHDFGAKRSTTVTLARYLPAPLARTTTAVLANVATASHGETRREVLGSGDSTQAFQSFVLRQPPLTYLSALNASGLQSTLSIWVDEVRWTAVDSLLGAGPGDRVYVARERDGRTIVQFGDGVTGARLPTGAANVRAVYRTGSGTGGRVHAGQLTLPTSRAGGVTGVGNPAPSEGGEDAETADSARVSAPLRVMTIDRVVSLPDYALFARAFPGVGKAVAVWARAASQRGVLVTAAGAHGTVLDAGTGVGANLLGALQQYGDPLVPVALVPHVPRSFRVSALVRTDPARVRDDVLSDAAARLAQAFSFEARDLGQPVAASEVLAVIQATPGVIAATITKLWAFEPGTLTSEPAGPPPDVLPAAAPAPGVDIATASGAELVVLDPGPINWGMLP